MDNQKKITFHYAYPDNFKPEYVNGVFGGSAPSGEIIMNFFAERPVFPDAVSNVINPDGTIGIPADNGGERNIDAVRDIKASLTMSEGAARAICMWLERELREIDARNNPTKEDKTKPNNLTS